jgi:hypothetical protein
VVLAAAVDTMVAVERIDKKKYRLTPPNGARLLVLSYRCRGPHQSIEDWRDENIAMNRSCSCGPQLAKNFVPLHVRAHEKTRQRILIPNVSSLTEFEVNTSTK